MPVEFEHGTRFSDARVTSNHPILTGKIVLAHWKESPEYDERLQIAEREGDLFKADKARAAETVADVMAKLAAANHQLADLEARQLGLANPAVG